MPKPTRSSSSGRVPRKKYRPRDSPKKVPAHWPSEIPQHAYHSYDDTLRLLTDVMPRRKGLLLGECFLPHLKVELDSDVELPLSFTDQRRVESIKARLLEKDRSDDLLHLRLEDWAEMELEHGSHQPRSKRLAVITFKNPLSDARFGLTGIIKDMIARLSHGWRVEDLVVLASHGDENSLLRLVQLDRLFMTSKLFTKWCLKLRAAPDDRGFFGRLANAVSRDTFEADIVSARLAIACHLLWYLGFRKLAKKDLWRFARAEGLADYPIRTFYEKLKRMRLMDHAKRVNKRSD